MRTDREPFFPKSRLRSTAGTILRFAGMRTRRQKSRHAHATQNRRQTVVAFADQNKNAIARAEFLSHPRSEEHTSELQSPYDLVCRLLLEKKNKIKYETQRCAHFSNIYCQALQNWI